MVKKELKIADFLEKRLEIPQWKAVEVASKVMQIIKGITPEIKSIKEIMEDRTWG